MGTNTIWMTAKAALMAALCSLSIGCAQPAVPPPVFACAEGICDGDDAQRLDQGKQRIIQLMNASDEADFIGVYVTNRGVCGKVTSTNSFGGTPPPRFFYVTSGAAVIEPQTRDNGGERLEFIDALTFTCST